MAVLNDKARDLVGLGSEDREANTVTVRLFFDVRDDDELEILEALTSMRLTHRRNTLVKKLIKAGFRAAKAGSATTRSAVNVDNRPSYLLNVKMPTSRSAAYAADLGIEIGIQDIQSNLYSSTDRPVGA